MIGSIIAYIIAVAVVLLIAKVFFKGTSAVIGFLVNAAVGAVVLWVLDIIGLGVPITWLTAAIVGFLGVPGVIIVVILKYVFKLF
ncbi:MAG: pro-sigmaK processing inhibitor BofA family protein [Clostridia bacterium]|nr:pro-sigmaK processing inhibitor BofA family protein [Clostridia bacterium]